MFPAIWNGSGDDTTRIVLASSHDGRIWHWVPEGNLLQTAAFLTPGVEASGPQGALVISGAPSAQNLYMVNGVVVTENIRGTPYDLYIEDALQETSTSVASISAEFGAVSPSFPVNRFKVASRVAEEDGNVKVCGTVASSGGPKSEKARSFPSTRPTEAGRDPSL
jgi:hypothetical protein